uniref:Uncharacterized protein n=1 Tax=Anguilla anguilla TaxID=7936 RepID=A0A0E9RFH7_ANGAN
MAVLRTTSSCLIFNGCVLVFCFLMVSCIMSATLNCCHMNVYGIAHCLIMSPSSCLFCTSMMLMALVR